MASFGLWDLQLQLLVPAVALYYVWTAPFTKVEESFTIQALHDWLFIGIKDIHLWDHQRFPGPVPRSFVPSFLLAVASYPWLLLLRLTGIMRTSASVQLVLRSALALIWSAAQLFFSKTLAEHIDLRGMAVSNTNLPSLRRWIHRSLLVTTLVQFRLPFYAGRTLPNSMALPLVLVGLALLLPRGLPHERRQITGVCLLVFTTVIYRLEIVGILAGVGLYLLHSHITMSRDEFDPHPVESIAKLAGCTQASLTLSSALSVGVDSWMWLRRDALGRRADWHVTFPEVEGLRFNVLEGRSAEWGVSPWHFYLTRALPGLLIFTLPLAVCGAGAAVLRALQSRTQWRSSEQKSPPQARTKTNDSLADLNTGLIPPFALVWIALVHIAFLSALRHKEWRFVMYVVPLLNGLGAMVAGRMFHLSSGSRDVTTQTPKVIARAFSLLIVALWGASLLYTGLAGLVSRQNYPGGEALRWLHSQSDSTQSATVHISVPAAMSGVTLFQSVRASRPPGGSGVAFYPWLPSVLAPSPTSQVWNYDKAEDLTSFTSETWNGFDYVLSQGPCDMLADFSGTPNFETLSPPKSNTASRARLQSLATGVFADAAGVSVIKPAPTSKGRFDQAQVVGRLGPLRVVRPASTASIEGGAGIHTHSYGIQALGWEVGVSFKTRDRVWVCRRAQ